MKPDPMLIETLDRLLGATCSLETIENAERSGWCDPVWSKLAEGGYPWIGIDAEVGGSGGSLADAIGVLEVVGKHSAPVPVAETGVLGGWALANAGFTLPEGPVSIASGSGVSVESGNLVIDTSVAWGHKAELVAVVINVDGKERVIALRQSDIKIERAMNIAGEPRDRVLVNSPLTKLQVNDAPSNVNAHVVELRGALSRVALIAGGLGKLVELGGDYTAERKQFGQPLAKFQAVQHHIVNAAEQAAIVNMALRIATRAVANGEGTFEVAAAKALASEAVDISTRSIHQAHGAMGVTREYPLHVASRRLWAWRQEYGSGHNWQVRLGRQALKSGAQAYFPNIAK